MDLIQREGWMNPLMAQSLDGVRIQAKPTPITLPQIPREEWINYTHTRISTIALGGAHGLTIGIG